MRQFHNPTHRLDVSQLLVVLHEEGEVLIGNIDLRVPTQLPVLFNGVSTTRESILIDLHEVRQDVYYTTNQA